MKYTDLGVEFKYLIENENDKKIGLTVNIVGFQSIQPNTPYPLTNNPPGYFINPLVSMILHEYQFVYITKGNGVLSFESEKEISISKVYFSLFFRDNGIPITHSLKQVGMNIILGLKVMCSKILLKNQLFQKTIRFLRLGLTKN